MAAGTMSSDQTFFIAIITPLLSLISAVLVVIFGRRINRNVEEVKIHINSRMDQLVVAERAGARAEGRDEQRPITDLSVAVEAMTTASTALTAAVTALELAKQRKADDPPSG